MNNPNFYNNFNINDEDKPVYTIADLHFDSSDIIYDAPPAYSPIDRLNEQGDGSAADFNAFSSNHSLLARTPSAAPFSLELTLEPTPFTCPHCRYTGRTRIEYVSGTFTWLMGCFLCFVSGCCCIPFMIESAKDVIHSCPRCNSVLGRYDRTNQ